jgi:RimJ/RimL family protein N-acetyltransferase
MSLPVLTTPRLILRALRIDDAPVLHAWLSDERVMRYWSTKPHRTIDETMDWVRLSLAEMGAGNAHDFLVLHGETPVGRVAFWAGNEVGYFIDPAFWGQGFATEALGALSTYGFDRLGFTEIRAEIDPDNAASLRVLEKLGFRRTGFAERTLEIGGRWYDSLYLALERADRR